MSAASDCVTCLFTVVLAVLTTPKGNGFQDAFFFSAIQLGSQWLHSTEDATQNNLGISNAQEVSIRTVSQDKVQMELPL